MRLKVEEDLPPRVVEVVVGVVKAARLHGGDPATHRVELDAPYAKQSAGALDAMRVETDRVKTEDTDRQDVRMEGRKSADNQVAAAQVLALRTGP